jgi:hypothetical protein
LKYNRAQEHLDALNQITQWWFRTQPYRIGEDVDAESGFKEIAVVADGLPPERIALVAGDAVQNLRNSLDHLIGDVARFASGGYLMPKVEQALQFPITTSKEAFRQERVRGRLGCVVPRAQAVIHRLQPYRSGENMIRHPLYVLQELSNIDKHRRLPVLLSVVNSVAFNQVHVISANHLTIGTGGPFEDKAVLVRMNPEAEVKVNLGAVRIDVAFGEGTPVFGEPVLQTLRDLSQWIANEVLGPLAPPQHAASPPPA